MNRVWGQGAISVTDDSMAWCKQTRDVNSSRNMSGDVAEQSCSKMKFQVTDAVTLFYHLHAVDC